MNETKKVMSPQTLAFGAILTAMVIVLQFMGTFIHLGVFSISLVLIPIVIGATVCGVGVGAWLGLVFGAVVLFSGDATPFMAINAIGTIITVLLKGFLCGLASAFTYKALSKKNDTLGVIASAIVCPIVNTGVFTLGCFVFFFDGLSQWALAEGFGSTVAYIFLFIIGANFIFELLFNAVLSPIIVKLIGIAKKQLKA
ncbi:MAG: ECF transporter S component [Ruminococcaceae bacterium]|nr:ECF transporter S component [Oscillospiraceae bacterium]